VTGLGAGLMAELMAGAEVDMTGLVTVQGQSVMVRVVASETV